MKKCTVCNKHLPLTDFYPCGPDNKWLRGECKACISAAYKIKNKNNGEYKVYLLKDRKTAEIIYVGCTSQTLNKRLNDHVGDKKVRPEDVLIELVQGGLTEVEGLKLEQMLIEQYKPTLNIYAGYKIHNRETVKKIVASSPKWLEAIKKSNSRPIICLNTGKTYESLRQAAKDLGLSEPKISQVCKGKRPHTKGYKFSYL